MGNIIISNNEKFICKYDDDYLPQLNVNGMDIEILLSQLGGARVRGDQKSYDKVHNEFIGRLTSMREKGDHEERLADAYMLRFELFANDPDGFAGKYILQWLDAKIKRS